MDIVGPFPIAMGKLKFLIVGIDYFTKWVEAEPPATIKEKNVQSNLKNVHRVFVSNNGKHFNNDTFRDFCQQLGIKNHYSYPAHP